LPLDDKRLNISRGCVTPNVVSNMRDETEMDPDLIDGWEDLDEESQEKVMRALKQGHVDDADWKGASLPLHKAAVMLLT